MLSASDPREILSSYLQQSSREHFSLKNNRQFKAISLKSIEKFVGYIKSFNRRL